MSTFEVPVSASRYYADKVKCQTTLDRLTKHVLGYFCDMNLPAHQRVEDTDAVVTTEVAVNTGQVLTSYRITVTLTEDSYNGNT